MSAGSHTPRPLYPQGTGSRVGEGSRYVEAAEQATARTVALGCSLQPLPLLRPVLGSDLCRQSLPILREGAEVIAAFYFLCAVCSFCLGRGAVLLIVWILDRRDARIDADYRAARLVAQARAEVGA